MPASTRRWVNRTAVYWAPLIAVMDQLPITDIARPDRVVERGERQVSVRAWAAAPADYLVGERISHAGQPQHTLPGGDAGQVGDPLAVGRGRGEVAVEQVRCRGLPRILLGGAILPTPTQVGALAAMLAHDPLDAFAADTDPTAVQFQPHPWRAVGGGELCSPRISSIMPSSRASSQARGDGEVRRARQS